MSEHDIATVIVATEKAALKQWNSGNPTGYLSIYAGDITYLDPIHRINGFEKIKDLYEGIRGKLCIEKHEMVDPVVQVAGEVAVLSYILESHTGNKVLHWNCTEVYQQQTDTQWKIIHSHWSLCGSKTE